MKYSGFIFILIVFTLNSESFSQAGVEYILFSSAVFDVLQQDHSTIEGRFEYRGTEFYSILKPLTGAMANTDGAVHFYAGVFIDIPLTGFLYITPSFAPGLYFCNGSKDLGFLLEFRSQVELNIKLNNEIRVGVSFNHLSNAGFGKYNPGVESIALTYHFPLH